MALYSARRRLQSNIEEFFGISISREYHGQRDWFDIGSSGCKIKTIFDVGANIGQSAIKFRTAFPDATIHCFEPIKDTFEELVGNVNGYASVRCHQIALGNKEGQESMYLTDQSLTNSLIMPGKFVGLEDVKVLTVDGFASDNQIERIDLLKVDTEGFDLEVLRGAQNLLSSGKIAFVLVEVGFHPGDSRHVLFDDVRSFLLKIGYSVFGVYDQTMEWSGEQRLRFANVCFSNESAFRKS
jgi:FkbM family methyltransferase